MIKHFDKIVSEILAIINEPVLKIDSYLNIKGITLTALSE